MDSVPGSMHLHMVEHEHLARSLGFPPNIQLWQADAPNVMMTRHRRRQSREGEHSPAGEFTIRALMITAEDAEKLRLGATMPAIRAEAESGETMTFYVLSIEVSIPDAPVSVHVLTRVNGERTYIVQGEFGSIAKKRDWNKMMNLAWEALAVVQSIRRVGPGRPLDSGRYPDRATLVAELVHFIESHGATPESKAQFIRHVGTSRDTLDAALTRFDIPWEEAVGLAQECRMNRSDYSRRRDNS